MNASEISRFSPPLCPAEETNYFLWKKIIFLFSALASLPGLTQGGEGHTVFLRGLCDPCPVVCEPHGSGLVCLRPYSRRLPKTHLSSAWPTVNPQQY